MPLEWQIPVLNLEDVKGITSQRSTPSRHSILSEFSQKSAIIDLEQFKNHDLNAIVMQIINEQKEESLKNQSSENHQLNKSTTGKSHSSSE